MESTRCNLFHDINKNKNNNNNNNNDNDRSSSPPSHTLWTPVPELASKPPDLAELFDAAQGEREEEKKEVLEFLKRSLSFWVLLRF